MNQKLYMMVTYNYEYKPEFFTNEDELKNWFISHTGWKIPEIYVLEYIGKFNNVNDVIKLNVLGQECYYYITAVNKNLLIEYKKENNLWRDINRISQSSPFYYPNQIYNALQSIGINLNNVYENENDRISEFDVVNERGFFATRKEIIKSLDKLRNPNVLVSTGDLEEKILAKRLNDMEKEHQSLKLVRNKPLIHFPDNTSLF